VYDKTMSVNARGTFLGCKYAIAQMMKQDLHPSGDRGWIINLSSVAGLVGFGGCREFSIHYIYPFLANQDYYSCLLLQQRRNSSTYQASRD
jgi:NAD(P)-dependent dehydrogenase (short-subunit alcohol dehydrogenase family)